MFETILNEDREKHTATVQDILKDYCCEIKVNKPKDEKTILKLACLVEKIKLEQFEKGSLRRQRNLMIITPLILTAPGRLIISLI